MMIDASILVIQLDMYYTIYRVKCKVNYIFSDRY